MKYKGSYFSYLLMYLFYFMSLALFSGLISVYLMDKGYSASQVSLVVSSSFIVSVIVQPFIGYLNDKYHIKRVNSFLLILVAVLGIIFIFANNIYIIAMIYSLALGLFNGTKPVIERMATLSKYQYGHIRIWGTLGYAIGSQLGGVIYQYISPEGMYISFSIGLFICILGILGTQDRQLSNNEINDDELNNRKLWNKSFLIYIIIICIFYGITNLNTTYLPAMFQSQGINVDKIATIILLITLSELPLIYYSHCYMNKITNHQMLIFIFFLLLIQFGTYSFIPYNNIQIIISICTKAVSTVIFIMLNMKIVATIVCPQMQMRALAWVSTFNSFSSIVFQSVGGIILDYYTYSFLYFILFISAFLGLIICLFYHLPSGNEYQLFK